MSLNKISERITNHIMGLSSELNTPTIKLLVEVNSVLLQQEGKIEEQQATIDKLTSKL